jgi:hypothetical protein
MAELVPLVPVEDEETDHKILEMPGSRCIRSGGD